MTAPTPGQAAYEALRTSWLANRIGSPSVEWEKLSDEERAEWEELLDAPAQEQPAPELRAALHDALRTAAGRIKRCTSAKPACTFCEADLTAVMEAADAYARSITDARLARVERITRGIALAAQCNEGPVADAQAQAARELLEALQAET